MSNRIDRGHGSPYDRGGADSYYRRGRRPHKECAIGKWGETEDLTKDEVIEYMIGYDENEAARNWKVW